jgi:hypothetical protein
LRRTCVGLPDRLSFFGQAARFLTGVNQSRFLPRVHTIYQSQSMPGFIHIVMDHLAVSRIAEHLVTVKQKKILTKKLGCINLLSRVPRPGARACWLVAAGERWVLVGGRRLVGGCVIGCTGALAGGGRWRVRTRALAGSSWWAGAGGHACSGGWECALR